ncbi:MAG TPA: class I SAM-dependent methyltransferase [Vicinamibacterales bacterium]|nr:class I SAM-dependent methyltransferase [Vicinamibacterales bacterium]
MPALANAYEQLRDVLRCPMCGGRLSAAAGTLSCTPCGQAWERPATGHLDLLPAGWASKPSPWARRQDETCRYYSDLVSRPADAVEAFRGDLAPFSEILSHCTGTVLDVGGGNGMVRAYLAGGTTYVSVDPSVEWLHRAWDQLGVDFPCLAAPLTFVHGVGEHLPFADAVFDCVLCLWALNHSADPERAVREMSRVLKPAGTLLLVLEDGEPTWRELYSGRGAHYLRQTPARLLLAKALAPLCGWPIQSDHLPIRHRALTRWTLPDLELHHRSWVGWYLALEYQRLPSPVARMHDRADTSFDSAMTGHA